MTPTDKSALLPCPFCGGEAECDEGMGVSCQNKQCAAWKLDGVGVGQWNRRAKSAERELAESKRRLSSELQPALDDLEAALASKQRQIQAIGTALGEMWHKHDCNVHRISNPPEPCDCGYSAVWAAYIDALGEARS